MVRGSYALGVLFREEPDTIYAVKKESPLIVGWGEGENFVASDIPALLKYTRRYSVLEEGDMAVVKADGIRFYDAFGKPVEREVLTADWDEEAAEKGGYPHFMLKEIHEQPAAITATVSPRVENGMPDLRIPELSDEKLQHQEHPPRGLRHDHARRYGGQDCHRAAGPGPCRGGHRQRVPLS